MKTIDIEAIFELGAQACYETLNQNTGACGDVEKYKLLKKEAVIFANSLTNLDEVKIDEEGNVLSEPKDYNSYLNVFSADRPMMHPWTSEDLDLFEQYQQAQTISERLQSDKEKIENLQEGVKTNGLLFDRNVELQAKVKELEELQDNILHCIDSDNYHEAKLVILKNETTKDYKSELTQSKAEVDRLKEGIKSFGDGAGFEGYEIINELKNLLKD
jgi:hypothetical protein